MDHHENLEQEDDFEFEGDRGDSPFTIHMIAGSLAGFAEHYVMFPLDTIKVYQYSSRPTCKLVKNTSVFHILCKAYISSVVLVDSGKVHF
jgi:hypothetical protein